MKINNKTMIVGISILVCVVTVCLLNTGANVIGTNVIEGYSNYTLAEHGKFPKSVDQPILDSFGHTGHKYASNDNSSGIWWYFPIFGVSSFKQITNNLRYRNNPDEGTCSRADMCGALYRRKKNKSNITLPLGEAQEGAGARVGYYRTDVDSNMMFSIPTNENILY